MNLCGFRGFESHPHRQKFAVRPGRKFQQSQPFTNILQNIAGWLANHENFKSHGRHLTRAELEGRLLKIEHLEADQAMQDLVLSVFHATTHTFSATDAVKIIENNLGRAFIKMAQRAVAVPQPQA